MIELKLYKPNYFLIPINDSLLNEYALGFSLGDVFKVKGAGILTAADELLVNTKINKLKENIDKYINDVSNIKLGSTILSKEKDPSGIYKFFSYKAFDNRFIYDSKLINTSCPHLTKHESIKDNYYLNFITSVRDNNIYYQHVIITKTTPDLHFFAGKANTYSAPLYIKENSND